VPVSKRLASGHGAEIAKIWTYGQRENGGWRCNNLGFGLSHFGISGSERDWGTVHDVLEIKRMTASMASALCYAKNEKPKCRIAVK
jgi:hypothetical protein